MRMLAALILSGLLAVLAYFVFWVVCLNYTTGQMKEAVAQGLGADIVYTSPGWVPDPKQVTMELPTVKMTMAHGPVREVQAARVKISSGFLMRDRWRMEVPGQVHLVLANGRKLLLETVKGEVLWRQHPASLTLRAETFKLTDEDGTVVADFDDVMLERKPSESGVRVNLASRPTLNGVPGVLSGEVVVPAGVFVKVVNLFGGPTPGIGDIMRMVVDNLQHGGAGANTVKLDNVSFKFGEGAGGAISGDITVMGDGKMLGKASLTADTRAKVVNSVQRSAVAKPRTEVEKAGMMRFMRSMQESHPSVTLENMQTTLTLNGNPVGALPDAMDVVNRLWPR